MGRCGVMGRGGGRDDPMRATAARQGQFAIDERLPTPLYHQIYLVFRNKILNDEYPHDSILPGEEEVARRFGVSRITAKRAINELAADGFVVRERGRGTRVVYRAPATPVRASVEGLLENLLQMGLKTEVELLEFGYVPPVKDVVRALQCEDGDIVQRAVRVRRLEGEPFSHLTTHVPEDIGRSYRREDLATRPLLSLLERGGVVVTSAEQTITATLADTETAPALATQFGSPLLRIDRIVYDQNDRPVEYIAALYRSDLYQYRMMLSRVQNEQINTWSTVD